ncbi:hypothetical protein [Ulvibacterium sp.]|uniref:hypothetical protein n=1 Tax=Ulvibacterium sp. TaxID=2665914 RepID=UPI003BAA0963
MKIRNIAIVLIGATFFWSCQNDDNGSPPESRFSIAADISGGLASYDQTVFDGGHNGSVNVFNRTDKSLYLQSFKNGKNDSEGFWTIRINGVDIENLTLPHSLTGAEGSVSWVDESLKPLQQPCSQADVLCFYSGVGVDEVTVTITDIEDNVISGEFSGRLNHIRINPTVIRDTDDFVEVANGKFSIKYQSK